MDWRTWTLVIMAVSAVVLIAWDIVVAFFNDTPNREDTISGITLGASLKFWTLPYVFGALGGHLFMPGVFLESVTWWGMALLLGIGIGLGAFGIAFGERLSHTRARSSLRAWGVLNAGLLMGHLFWPQ